MDFAGLTQKVNAWIAVVASWVAIVGDMFFSNTAQNVTVKSFDDNGNLVDMTLPNRAMIKKQIWDDVSGALGQFSKKVYVSNSGDDSSAGTNSEPFLTIEKACKAIPIGGVGFIYLKGGEIFTPMEDLEIEGKQIVFLKNGSDKPKIKIHTFLDSNDRINAFLFGNFLKLGSYAVAFKSIDIEEEENDYDDKERVYSKNAFFPTVYDGYLKNRFIYFLNCNIKTKYLDVIASPVSTFGYSWSVGGGNTLIKARSSNFVLGHNLTDCTESFVDFVGKYNTFKDRDGNDKTLDEVVSGISIDSNSNPVNFRKLEL